MVTFSRRQLIDRDYNPLEDPEGLNRADLEKRCGLGERRFSLDHAAAVRGILVSDGKNLWKWIWDWGLLYDAPPLPLRFAPGCFATLRGAARRS